MLIALLSVSHGEHTELKDMLTQSFSPEFDNPDPKLAYIIKAIVTDWSFLIFAGTGWMWVLLMYFFMACSNMMLHHFAASLRPSLALSQEGLPLWLPALVCVSGILAFVGNSNDRFAGQTAFLILLLPYFLCGIAAFHRLSLDWKGREIWLTLFYVGLAFFFPWIAALLIAFGIKTQAEALFKEKSGTL
jgi:hypothetical protein